MTNSNIFHLNHAGSVTCRLPGCGKKALHFAKHLKNIHLLSATELLVRLRERKESKRESPYLHYDTLNVDESNETESEGRSDKNSNKDYEYTSEVSESAEELN